MTDEVAIKRVQKLVEQYLQTRSRRHDLISTRAAHLALSQVTSLQGISDKEMDELIAEGAIARGLSVCFDREANDRATVGDGDIHIKRATTYN